MSGTWKATCVGTVVEVSDQSTDKTGRNERGITTLKVKPETIEASVEGVTFGETLDFAMDRERLAHRLGRTPAVGDRLQLTGTTTGVRPRRATIDTVTFVEEPRA